MSTRPSVKQASHVIYGSLRVFLDLREAGEIVQQTPRRPSHARKHLRALPGFRIRRWSVGKPSIADPQSLQR